MAATGADTALARRRPRRRRARRQARLRPAHQPHRRNVAAGGLPLRPLRRRLHADERRLPHASVPRRHHGLPRGQGHRADDPQPRGLRPGQAPRRQVQRLRPGRPRRRHQLALRHRARANCWRAASSSTARTKTATAATTPWGSWLSCEENTEGPTQGFEKPHGYVFEVPSKANRAVEPVPIKAMGRMEHEAAAIDPRSGVVYLTEDNGDPADGFYRFLPNDTRRLHKGGTLQMLAVEGRGRYDTTHGQTVGRKLHCEWVTIDDPDPPEAETEPAAVWRQGRAKGAAQFIGRRGLPLGEGLGLLRRLRRRGRRRGPDLALHPARPQARRADPALRVDQRKASRRTGHDHGLAARRGARSARTATARTKRAATTTCGSSARRASWKRSPATTPRSTSTAGRKTSPA